MTTKQAAKPRKVQRRRAKQPRAQTTVTAILDAAAQVLVRDGYVNASTNRIAERAGVSVGSVYEYFRNKEDLFDALIQRQAGDTLSRIVAEAPAPGQPLEETLRSLVFAALAAQREYGPELYRQLEHVPNAVFRRRLTEAKRTLRDLVKSLLEAHRDRLRVRDLDLAAFVAVNAAEGIGYNASAKMFDERLAEEVTALLVRYLLGTDPPSRRVSSR